jgi:hypothetical protein
VFLAVIVHGGPAGVFLRTFTGNASPYLVAAFASRGYALFRCNVRGSSGYSRDFRYANRSDWGGGDYRDIMSGVDALISKGHRRSGQDGCHGVELRRLHDLLGDYADEAVQGCFGGSRRHEPDEFHRHRRHSEFRARLFRRRVLGRFRSLANAFRHVQREGCVHADAHRHGEADLRVPISQGYEFYNALKRQNVPVTMVVYPRQPHGIQEPKLLQEAMQRNLDWFDRWIKGTQVIKEGHYLFTPK